MVDVIIFAVIAGVLFWKFKGLLGKEDETVGQNNNTQQIKDITLESKEQAAFKINFLENKKDSKEQKKIEIEEKIKANLILLKPELEADYKALSETIQIGFFDIKAFHDGIENLLIELINAKNTKDTTILSNLSSPNFIEKFTSLLQSQPLNQITELVKIENIEILQMNTNESSNTLNVKVLTQQIQFAKDGETLISGSVSIPNKFADNLKITRNFKNQVGSWILSDIE